MMAQSVPVCPVREPFLGRNSRAMDSVLNGWFVFFLLLGVCGAGVVFS